MTEKSKQVLKRNRIRAINEVTEKRCDISLPFSKDERDTSAKYGKSCDEQNADDCYGSRYQTEI